jgi:molecular chaperone DnaK
VATVQIARNTTIPTHKSEIFSTASDNQTSVEVNILQGERQIARDNRSQGKFHLNGNPSAPRGVPQIEVAFDIDANGILNVTATDKATNKEQNITITASSGISESEIEKMVTDAEEHEAEDAERREAIEARNKLDSMLHSSRKVLEEAGDKIPDDEKLRAEEEFKSAAKVLEDNQEPTSPDELRSALESLEAVAHKLAELMYKGEGMDGEEAGDMGEDADDDEPAGDEGVIDAEFEESPEA